MVAYTDCLLIKHNHNGAAAAQPFLLVLGAAFDGGKLHTAALRRRYVTGFTLTAPDELSMCVLTIVSRFGIKGPETTASCIAETYHSFSR